MGMDAQLIAFGPFRWELLDALDYPPDKYALVPEGAVIATVIGTACTSDLSRDLARAIGADPWSFEQHCVRGDKVDPAEVSLALQGDIKASEVEVLIEAGWRFIYLPNG